MSRPDVSIVIPVYRSEETLRPLVYRLIALLEGVGRAFEIVLVDDGSPDRTWQVAAELQRHHPRHVVAVQLMRNYGQHNALMCGFRHAQGAVIVTMDDDLQHPPEAVPELLAALESSGLDLIYGVYRAKHHRPWRNLGSWLVNVFYRWIFGNRVTVTAFRALRGELARSILTYDLNFTYVDGLLAWNTQRIGEYAVEHRPRASGRSGYSLGKLVLLALNLFTNFSLLPLQAVSACGLATALGGFVMGAYYLVAYFRSGIDVPGYASIIVSTLVLGGVQLLALGIMGEYLGRLHLNVNRKPQFTIRRVLRSSEGVEVAPGAAAEAEAEEGRR